MHSNRVLTLFSAAILIAGCTTEFTSSGDAVLDSGVPDQTDTSDASDHDTVDDTLSDPEASECTENDDCDDGIWCNGTETCEAGYCHDQSLPCDEGCAVG